MRLVCSIILGLFSLSAFAGEYYMPLPGNDIIGRNYSITVRNGDSLTTLREGHNVSYDELLEANPDIDFYKLRVGQKVLIPKQFILPKYRRGIVINTAELRIYYFTPDGRYVYTFPVGLGRKNWRTPLTSATVVRKKIDPVWYVPDDIRDYIYKKTGELISKKVPPGPKNPLGNRALYLSKSGYLIHGTNAPHSVGTFISSGCVRLMREPIELLYQEVQLGTPVHIIYQPNKAGWYGDKLYLESHAPIKSYEEQPESELNEINIKSAIYDAVHLRPAYVNWDAVSYISDKHTGIPKQIGSRFTITD